MPASRIWPFDGNAVQYGLLAAMLGELMPGPGHQRRGLPGGLHLARGSSAALALVINPRTMRHCRVRGERLSTESRTCRPPCACAVVG